MATINMRELNQRTAAVLNQVTDADDVIVTEGGKPRWRISIVRDHETALAGLEGEGRYTPPASTPAPWPSVSDAKRYTDAQIDALRDETLGATDRGSLGPAT